MSGELAFPCQSCSEDTNTRHAVFLFLCLIKQHMGYFPQSILIFFNWQSFAPQLPDQQVLAIVLEYLFIE